MFGQTHTLHGVNIQYKNFLLTRSLREAQSASICAKCHLQDIPVWEDGVGQDMDHELPLRAES